MANNKYNKELTEINFTRNIYIIISSSERGGIFSLTSMLSNNSNNVHIIKFNFKNYFKLLIKLILNNKKFPFSIVLTSPSIFLFFLPLLIFKKVRMCLYYWPHHLPHIHLEKFKIKSFAYYFIEAIICNLCRYFIFVSKYQENTFKKYYKCLNKKKLTVLPPTLGKEGDNEFLKFNKEDLKFNKSKFIFSIFSRFDRDSKTTRLKKYLDRFLFSIDSSHEIDIYLYGNGSLYKNFPNFINYPNVNFHLKGWSENLIFDMNICDFIICEGEGETFHLISALSIYYKFPLINLTSIHPLNNYINKPIFSYYEYVNKFNSNFIEFCISVNKRSKDTYFLEDTSSENYLKSFLSLFNI